MKKILLVGINAKYIHSNPAIRCLKSYAEQKDPSLSIGLLESTINKSPDEILEKIIAFKPDLVGFSCYIFNIETVLKLTGSIKKIFPDCHILLGGPEAGYRAASLMAAHQEIDFIIRGEGERPFLSLLQALHTKNAELTSCPSLFFRQGEEIVETPESEPLHHTSLPYRYTEEEIASLEHKIIYFESSRGCPYRCSYCLSSIDKHLRFFPLNEVLEQLSLFLRCKVPQVKFIDRTFNCDPSRAEIIWKYLLENDNGVTNFHFEIAAEQLSSSLLELLGKMRPGLVQLEIGVQSTNEETLRAIHRPSDFGKVREKVSEILERKNVHVHLDLIAGLPKENFSSFVRSFNDVYSLHPHQFQLGFLKLLAGSILENEAEAYGIVCRDHPPYEVLKTADISFAELSFLKRVEELVDLLYNSGRFSRTLAFLIPHFSSPFSFYSAAAETLKKKSMTTGELGKFGGYELIAAVAADSCPDLLADLYQTIKFDIFARERARILPEFLPLSITKQNDEKIKELLSVLPEGSSQSYHIERFEETSVFAGGYYAFCYTKRDLFGNAEAIRLD